MFVVLDNLIPCLIGHTVFEVFFYQIPLSTIYNIFEFSTFGHRNDHRTVNRQENKLK